MKILTTLLFLFLGAHTYALETFETRCKKQDCFRFGWVTTGVDYSLDTVCTHGDCRQQGWSSVAIDQSTYQVQCHKGGCFTKGWSSIQLVEGMELEDEVTCKSGGCLVRGWTVETGYDLMGGDVTCHRQDCSRYGGYSSWRGKRAHTVCYEGDCYHKGWTLYVE